MEKEFENDVLAEADIKNSHAYKAISWIFNREGVKLFHTLRIRRLNDSVPKWRKNSEMMFP